MNIIFLGAPGAGKGTQAQVLSERLGVPKLSTGEILRREITRSSELGLKVKYILDSGQLVPDDIMNDLVSHRLAESDVKKGFILDGYPRTLVQAEALQGILKLTGHLDKTCVLNLSVEEPELIRRFTGRYSCAECATSYHRTSKKPIVEGVCDKCGSKEFVVRADDNEEAVKVRLEIYYEKTAPLINYYRSKGMLFNIDGQQDIDDITSDIMSVVDNNLKKGNETN